MADILARPEGLDEYVATLESPEAPAAAPSLAPSTPRPEGLDTYVAGLQEQQADDALQESHGTFEQQAKAGLEGAARGLLGSAATTWGEVALGVKPENIRKREEANPITAGVAEAGTFLGSALLGTGEAAALAKAAEVIPAAKAGSRLASGLSGAGRAAFEGLLYQGDKELAKAFNQDPAQTSDSVITNMGMTAVLGGLFGGAAGAAFSKATAPEAAKLGTFVSELDHPAIEAGDLVANIKAADHIKPSLKEKVLDAISFGKEKPAASEIKSAAQELGAPVLPGMTLESPLVQTQLDALMHSRYTVAGNRVGAKFDEAYNSAAGALDEAINAGPVQSKAALGEQLQAGLTAKTRAEYEPIKQGYEAWAAEHGGKEIGENLSVGLKNALGEIPEFRVSPSSPGGRMVKQVLQDIDNVKTINDLKIVRDGIDIGPMASSQERRMMGILKDKLSGIEEGIIGQPNPHAPAYKKYIGDLSQFSEMMGKGKVHGTEDALRFLNERLTPEQVANRVFSKNDSGALDFFSKKFPEEFQTVRNYQRAEMIEKATRGDQGFNAKAFFTNFNKLEPEIQTKLYTPGEIKKINAAETYIRNAFPKNFNPSGTSHAEALREAYASPKGFAVANIRDYALEKAIQMAAGSAEGSQAVELAQATIKGEHAANKAIKAIFDKTKQMPASVIPMLASRAKMDRLASRAAEDPSRLVAMNDSNNSVPEYNAPLAASATRVVNYLAQLKPKTAPTSPLDGIRAPSAVEKAAYDRALDIAEQPLSILAAVKKGNITPADIQAVMTMYPNLYNNLVTKITGGLADHIKKGGTIPYATRMGLSMFLGQPLDSTFTPMGIANAQPAPSAPPPSTGVAKGYQAKGLQKIPSQHLTPDQAKQQRRQE